MSGYVISEDELNILDESMRSMDYEEYFGEMDLTDEEKEKRIELAKKFENAFLFILSLVAIMDEYDKVQWEQIKIQLQEKYISALDGYVDTDEYVTNYVSQFADDITRSTQDNMGDTYNTSYDRARFMAENEANSMLNHQDLMDAIANGMTRKTWVTMRDRKVRHTHQIADGQTVGVYEPFMVGDSLMLMPKDTETYGASASETVNCRCSVKFN